VLEVLQEILNDPGAHTSTVVDFAALFDNWQARVLAKTDPLYGLQTNSPDYTEAWSDGVVIAYPEEPPDIHDDVDY